MAKPQAYPEWQAALAPAPEIAPKDKLEADKPKAEKLKSEPPKEPEKRPSIFKWPFGDSKK